MTGKAARGLYGDAGSIRGNWLLGNCYWKIQTEEARRKARNQKFNNLNTPGSLKRPSDYIQIAIQRDALIKRL
jgi:hypothetical protein